MLTRTPHKLSSALLCILALAGCQPNKETPSHRPSATTSNAVKPDATMKQWSKAVASTYDKVNVKKLRDKGQLYVEDNGPTDENGINEFFACFDKSPPKCDVSASGRRDNFRKIQFFMDPALEWSAMRAKYDGPTGKPFVSAYISIRDCGEPKLILQPIFRASNWLFLDQLAIMADGAVVIDKKIGRDDAERENTHNSVSEVAHLPLSNEDVVALRKLNGAKQILIRLSGQKGYVGIDKKITNEFTLGVAKLLQIHDALMRSAKSVGVVSDSACLAKPTPS